MTTDLVTDLFSYLDSYTRKFGFSPSYREMQDALGYASTATVKGDLEALRDKGMVTWAQGKSRSVRVVDA